MKLIAKKPCSFGGKRFYIGEEVPTALVVDPARQVQYGVLIRKEEDCCAMAEPTAESVAEETPAAPKKGGKKSGKKPVEEVGEA